MCSRGASALPNNRQGEEPPPSALSGATRTLFCCLDTGYYSRDTVQYCSTKIQVLYCTVGVSAPKLSTIKYLECENHVSEEFFCGKYCQYFK